jgi:hypothetical protein
MWCLIVLQLALMSWLPPDPKLHPREIAVLVDHGLSAIYGGPGDTYSAYPGGDATATGAPLRADGVAHRTLPLNTKVLVVNMRTGLRARGRIRDRGPYGCKRLDGKPGWTLARKVHDQSRPRHHWKRECPAGWTFKGVLDVTPGFAKAIRHRGRDEVQIYTLVPIQ